MDDTRSTLDDMTGSADTGRTAGAEASGSGAGDEAPGTGGTGGWGDQGPTDQASGTAKEWLAQLQSMIEGLAQQAAPVAREIGAKAAELAAIAGEKAGPFAHRAAEVTEQAGSKIAERGRDLAAELRRDKEDGDAASETGWDATATAIDTTTSDESRAG